MYAGHVGIALALRRVPGAPPLWLLALAAQGPDWGDLLRELVGPLPGDPVWWLPHALPLLLAGAALAGALAWWQVRSGRAVALVAAAWLSHWPADWLTGLKPTYVGGPWLGLRWFEQRPWLDLAVEGALLVVGWLLWRRTLPTPPPPRARAVASLALAALLVLQLTVDLVFASAHR
ncbi:MAG TPA: hypothetical protein VEZ47_05395 [Gemmatirosa sp.]|nr:hypothetical protein [Gemmatirosa sp.]